MLIKSSDGNLGESKFAKGCKFVMGGMVWVVKEELYSDNTPMRRIANDAGDEEITMLSTLEKDAGLSEDFKIIEEQGEVPDDKEDYQESED